MIERNTGVTASTGDPDHLWGAEKSFPVSVLASFPVTETRGDGVVVDATDFLVSDAYDVRRAVRGAGLGQIQLERDRGYVDASFTRAFPSNTEIRTISHLHGGGHAFGTHPTLPRFPVHHLPAASFIHAASGGSVPAPPFDPRTGNSSTTIQDYGQAFDEDYRLRYVVRWRLEPSDPAAYLRGEVVEPVTPIVFHLDPAIPSPTGRPIGRGWNGGTRSSRWPGSGIPCWFGTSRRARTPWMCATR
jgi:hypothetical protein